MFSRGCIVVNKWNESGFRPPLCTYRLNWARKTSWGWWDDWDDTVLQTQDSKFEPWRSEAEHATSRSRRLPTILTLQSSSTEGNLYCLEYKLGQRCRRWPNYDAGSSLIWHCVNVACSMRYHLLVQSLEPSDHCRRQLTPQVTKRGCFLQTAPFTVEVITWKKNISKRFENGYRNINQYNIDI